MGQRVSCGALCDGTRCAGLVNSEIKIHHLLIFLTYLSAKSRDVVISGAIWRGVTVAAPANFGNGFSAFQAVTTDGGRPSSFCGVPCGM